MQDADKRSQIRAGTPDLYVRPEFRAEAETRAQEIEQQMTDEERFSLLISVMGATNTVNPVRDKRIPDNVSMSAGYTPGVPLALESLRC